MDQYPKFQTAESLVKKYFPDISTEEVEYILWEKTSFPCLFSANPLEELEAQIGIFKAATENDKDVCVGCSAILDTELLNVGLCPKCYEIFE